MPLSPSRIDQALSFAVLSAVIVGCFFVLKPFITALVWAAILCTTTWPLYLRVAARLRNRDGLAAFAMVLLLALIMLAPFLVVGATIPLMLALQLFVTRTTWGKAMRATAQDREAAQAMGINVEKTIILTFLIGGALAGAAGIIQGMYYNIGQWYVGYQAGLRAFTAAVLGGIGNMPGAALGGLVIGFLSAWSDQYISARWTNAVVFTILILVLVFRPHGLLGERTVDKV